MPFSYGVEVLLDEHADWLKAARLGLVAHPASVTSRGQPTPDFLREHSQLKLACLFGPEHGFDGQGDAGEMVRDKKHASWNIPIFSLYGDNRKPGPEMLAGIDVILFDLQDLGVRCYTYVSTLRYLLEAAAECQKTVIVCDRPIPLANTVDGPMLTESCRSFVGLVDTPMVYGMTPGETARWLRNSLGLNVDLRVAEMRGYHRESRRSPSGTGWIPPSPAIRAWETGHAYPATVFCEALPALDCGRRTPLSFQIISAPWLDGAQTCEALNARRLPGARFTPHPESNSRGIRLRITDPDVFRPVQTTVTMLDVLAGLYGRDRLWQTPGTREDFFDKLLGAASVRAALQRGDPADSITRPWAEDLDAFAASRRRFLLYAA